MKIPETDFNVTDLEGIPAAEYLGETGSACWHTLQSGDLRTRIVEYSPGYAADHWCSRGHIVLVLEGELITELQDGRNYRMLPGMLYIVSDDKVPHRSRTGKGAKIFIVD